MRYRMLKTLDHEGKKYFRTIEADLDLPEDLERTLIADRVLERIKSGDIDALDDAKVATSQSVVSDPCSVVGKTRARRAQPADH